MSKAPADMLTVRLPRQDIDRLEKLSAAYGYSRSEFIRVLLRRAIAGVIAVKPKEATAGVRGGVAVQP